MYQFFCPFSASCPPDFLFNSSPFSLQQRMVMKLWLLHVIQVIYLVPNGFLLSTAGENSNPSTVAAEICSHLDLREASIGSAVLEPWLRPWNWRHHSVPPFHLRFCPWSIGSRIMPPRQRLQIGPIARVTRAPVCPRSIRFSFCQSFRQRNRFSCSVGFPEEFIALSIFRDSSTSQGNCNDMFSYQNVHLHSF